VAVAKKSWEVMTDSIWEDNLLEKKLESDLKDLLKTLVAFANSVSPNHKALLLIGERDNGTVQGVINPDNIQKQIRKECEKIYPPIIWRSTVYEKEDKFCIRVEVDYDGDTPHFGGSAWIRKGSETIIASEDVFQQLIDLRSEMVR
jgi:predicted HTH transcriptional regulator